MPTEINGQTQDPLQGLHFVVVIDGARIGFAECQGLSAEAEIAEYREGNDLNLNTRKFSGLISYERIVLKRGWTQDNSLAKWWEEIAVTGPKAPVNPRRSIMIHVMDRRFQIKKTYSVVRAIPAKYETDDLVATNSEVLIETLELEHEGCFRSQPGKFQATPLAV